jgi:N-acetylmuramoyl-L-alanine amidase
MSDRWVPRRDSPWSSERERARRGQRAARPPEASSETPGEGSSFVPRRPARPAAAPEPAQQPEPAPSSTERIDRLMAGESPRTGRSSRQALLPGGNGDEPPGGLPDLPGSGGSGGPTGNRIIILGALLFLAMAMIFTLPRLLGGDDGTAPTPTPEMIQTPTPPADQVAEAAQPTRSIENAEHLVCIDAGHGGWDDGRVREQNSRAPGILEKDINLGMAWMLKERLEQEGIAVVMTRESGLAVNVFNEDVNDDGQTLQDSEQAGDRDELQARINICNEAGADLLISLHLNGYDDPAARGYEVLYTRAPFRPFGDRSADFATYVYREIGAAYKKAGFDTTPRGALPDDELNAVMHDGGVERHLIMLGPAIENADYTINPSQMPGIIIEPVFITNDDDAAFIARTENQRLLVDAYAGGILQYFEKYPDAP